MALGQWVCRALLVCLAGISVALGAADVKELDITVPESYKVDTTDAYVCAIVALPTDAHKLIGVVPLADQAVVHHILLYGGERARHMPHTAFQEAFPDTPTRLSPGYLQVVNCPSSTRSLGRPKPGTVPIMECVAAVAVRSCKTFRGLETWHRGSLHENFWIHHRRPGVNAVPYLNAMPCLLSSMPCPCTAMH